MKKLNRKSVSPPFKKTSPCTILSPHFFNFSDPHPSSLSRGGNQNLFPPLKEKRAGEGAGRVWIIYRLFRAASVHIYNHKVYFYKKVGISLPLLREHYEKTFLSLADFGCYKGVGVGVWDNPLKKRKIHDKNIFFQLMC